MSTFEANRRQLLHFLLTSPVLAGLGVPLAASGPDVDDVITTARQALNVMDFEAAARRALPPAHFGYLATGVDDEATLRANREGFSHFSLRVRRLVNVREIDMSVSLFGTSWDSPIVLAPVSSLRAFHADGEIASATAARTRNHLQVLSTLSSTDVEAVGAARGAPVWYQLYATDQWRVTEALVRRAEAAGCPALVLTVDLQGGSNRETLERARRRDPRDCTACRRSWKARRAGCPCSSTGVSGEGPTSSRRWRWVQRPCASGGPTSGGSRPSARKGWKRCSTCFGGSWPW